MTNPFCIQEIPVDAPFCDREKEMRDLLSYARSRTNVVLFSPRRYGKTSLARRVQKSLAEKGAITIFADFFGAASIDDVAARLAKAVFAVAYARKPLWRKALEALRAFRPVLKPDAQGGVSLTVEPSSGGAGGPALLEETAESLGRLMDEAGSLVQVTLDEFQEITALKEALRIEAVLRAGLQRHRASCFFVGSRRRVLLGIFNDRQRPFFQSSVNYPLAPLPEDELSAFLLRQFKRGRKSCDLASARKLAALVECHPYYAQKLAFFIWEYSAGVSDESIRRGAATLLLSEKPVFEAVTQGLALHQRLLLRALAEEPARQLLSSAYLKKHGLGSIGGMQHSARHLEELDLIEKDEKACRWKVVDPVFAWWLRKQSAQTVRD